MEDSVEPASQKLGEFPLKLFRFPHLKERLDLFEALDFQALPERKRMEKVHKLLLELIQETSAPCFLLSAINEFIFCIRERKWLELYSFSKFELWLNLFSGLSEEENYQVRAKIMGRYIPREAYQPLFPIGMGKKYPGSHYVTAHSSPDLDTTVASFWGWVDSFAARVGEGLHIWNIPGGAPESQIEVNFLFSQLLGDHCFEHFVKTRTSLTLSAVDLVTREGLLEKRIDSSLQALDYGKKQRAIVLVDSEGNYLADWRHLDAEGVRKVVMLITGSLRWFVSYFQRHLTALFSKKTLSKQEVFVWEKEMFSFAWDATEPYKGFTDKQKKYVDACLIKVLGIAEGSRATFGAFWDAMEKIPLPAFSEFRLIVSSFPSSLFNAKDELVEDRPVLFAYLEKLMTSLEESLQSLRAYFDHLGVSLAIKKEVFGYPLQVVSSRAEVEEIRTKIGPLSHITVMTSDADGVMFALGIIPSSEIFKPILGTVSLRDFCNREETKVPSYFEVISVVDHHKSSLSTLAASTVSIADAQSANTLVAELAFEMNDLYSTSGCDASETRLQMQELQGKLSDPSSCRVLKRLLQKHLIQGKKLPYFVDPRREYLEYLQCLYAILDDTDLLSKVSYRDVVCVTSLLNRLKTLQLKREVEILSLEDLLLDETFVAKAAERILQNEEMYSLYKKIYDAKEQSIEENIRLSVQKKPSNVFADTKVQNGCCRVGQTKLFAKNFSFYDLHAQELRLLWCEEAMLFHRERPECDLHMHMVTTVPGSDEVYKGNVEEFAHRDELWFWIPMEEQAIEHLKMFLNAFRSSPQVLRFPMEIEFLGENRKELEKIFQESFVLISKKETENEKNVSIPVSVLRYKAGLLNSRKAMISPYLPKL
jgi:hypothetical protein